MSTALSLHRITDRWRFMTLVTIAGLLFAVAFSFLTPLQYSSSIRLLITQTTAVGTDPYTAIKFTERIASSLSELLYSSSFANNIISKTNGLDQSTFSADEYERRKQWKKAINASVTPGTGIMVVTAYDHSRDQATALVESASRELTLQTPNYFGNNVRVQIIDSPLASRWFARPDFLKNAVYGAVLGFLLSLIWVLGKLSSKEARF